MNEQALSTPDTYSYLLLAINAAIHLQAMVLKQYKMSIRESQKLRTFDKIPGAKLPTTELRLVEELRTRRQWLMEEELQSFMAEDFYKVLRESALIPDRHTYEVMFAVCIYTLLFSHAHQPFLFSILSSSFLLPSLLLSSSPCL